MGLVKLLDNKMLYYHFQLSKNKSFELQIDLQKDLCVLFNFDFRLTRKLDHAGLSFDFSVWKFHLMWSVFDHRHWDDDNDCWMVYKDGE